MVELPTILATVALCVVIVSAVMTMWSEVDRSLTDSTADWLVVKAAQSGLDPWDDLTSLADRLDVEFAEIGGSELGDLSRVHPRTPAALLILSPLTLTSPEGAFSAMIGLTALGYFVSIVWVLPSLTGFERRQLLIVGVIGVAGTAFLTTLEFGTHSGVLLLLISGLWLAMRRGLSGIGGALLGIAGALRIFPLLLVIPLWRSNQRRAVYWAVSSFTALNLLGLLVFDLTFVDSLRALAEAGAEWVAFSGNGSLAMPLARLGVESLIVGVGLMIGAALMAWTASSPTRDPDVAFGSVLILALLSSPLSWEHYDLILIPVVAVILSTVRPSGRRDPILWAVGSWGFIQLVATPVDALVSSPTFSATGIMSLTGRMCLLVCAVLALRRCSGRVMPLAHGS